MIEDIDSQNNFQNHTENNIRIAKNTILLYLRMFISMMVGLFTSRVIIGSLGNEDYGINNVVGGVVAMFGFLNAAMTTSTQRYLTFELGKGDIRRLRLSFMTSIQIHLIISLIVLILAETIGLWFFYEKLVIPENRMTAAMWVYQLAIASSILGIMNYPFIASIVAHEKLGAFAFMSIFDVAVKLVVAYVLYTIDSDKLIAYALMMFGSQVIVSAIYVIYNFIHFDETHFRKLFDSRLMKEMGTFAGWNMWGNMAYIMFTQGLNILLNMFFGPIVNAARGVSVQVQGLIIQFANNFQTALNPQITKTYARGDLTEMHNLVFRSSRFSFFLLSCLSLPVLFEAETLLDLWLKDVPEYAPVFLRLILCVAIIDSVANPLMVSVAATGNVKKYQSVVGGILLAIVPVSYIVLRLGCPPYAVYLVHLVICIIAFVVRLFILGPMIGMSISEYCKQVISRCFVVLMISLVLPVALKLIMVPSLWTSLGICAVSALSAAASTFYVGFTDSERQFIVGKLKTYIPFCRG